MSEQRQYLPDGDELRRRRVALGLSQRQVAALLPKAGHSQISHAENGIQSSHQIQQAYAALLDALEQTT